jgi:hypothetical protein
MIDIAILAGTVVGKILLPVFVNGVEKVFEAAKDEVGDQVATETKGLVSTLWSKLRARMTRDDEKVMLDAFEEQPADAAKLMESTLRKHLENDPELASELDALVRTKPGGGTLDGAQVVARTMNVLTVHGGVSGGIVTNQYFGQQPPPGPSGT